jgi:hypothetical protein
MSIRRRVETELLFETNRQFAHQHAAVLLPKTEMKLPRRQPRCAQRPTAQKVLNDREGYCIATKCDLLSLRL